MTDGDEMTTHEGHIRETIDLALHLLEREFGPDLAARVADTMAYERRGEVSVRNRT